MAKVPLVAVLAAGRGSRFGGGKLDAACAGRPVGRWVLDVVGEAGLGPGLVVAPPDGVSFALGCGWEQLVNPAPERGLGSSLALAADSALERGAPALLVLLADMPLVDAAFLRRLASSRAPAATVHGGDRAGVPALLPASLLPQVRRLSGDEGAAHLLANAGGLTLLDPPSGMLLDIDWPGDLALVEGRLLRDV